MAGSQPDPKQGQKRDNAKQQQQDSDLVKVPRLLCQTAREHERCHQSSSSKSERIVWTSRDSKTWKSIGCLHLGFAGMRTVVLIWMVAVAKGDIVLSMEIGSRFDNCKLRVVEIHGVSEAEGPS